jgi:hypothetical protein
MIRMTCVVVTEFHEIKILFDALADGIKKNEQFLIQASVEALCKVFSDSFTTMKTAFNHALPLLQENENIIHHVLLYAQTFSSKTAAANLLRLLAVVRLRAFVEAQQESSHSHQGAAAPAAPMPVTTASVFVVLEEDGGETSAEASTA